ncbi:MAG TPA: aldehyde dehydrogenase, partial [bacterium]|nr:aldehyde dehydrogenase [bacterium]
EEAWADLIKRDWLAVVYGGADEGGYLCHHAGIHEVHITGSDKTHDMIVWGPPGPEREDRKRRNDPLLKKEISSELGTVSPVLVVPGPWDSKSLSFQAENLAGMVTNNASFNCNAAKMLVTAKGWDRTEFLYERIMAATAAVPTRKAWYPGARQRYEALTAKRAGLRTVGATGADLLPWTLIPGLNPDDVGELAFTMEPFCSILSATEIGDSKDPVDFLERAVEFSNKRVWGTLSATMVVHPKSLKDPAVRDAVERAVTRLKYGAVGINTWPAWAYALGDTPWGAHPSSTLDNIQGGKGWVHNAHMIEHTEKVVIRAPVSAFPKPPYFPTHRTAHGLGRALMEFEAKGWSKLPAVAIAGMRG